MNKPLFSIIVPIYNKEQYLRECVDSLIPQVLDCAEGAEILLLDDGSSDGSVQLCDDYAARYPQQVHVYHNENQGLLLTRRFGMRQAAGEYILNCDADDCMEPQALERLTAMIRQYQEPDVIFYNWCAYKDGAKTPALQDVFCNGTSCAIERERVCRELLSGIAVVSMCSKAVRRSCLDIDRDYSADKAIGHGEDTLQTIPIINAASSYVYLNETLYCYRMGSGMTNQFDPTYYAQFKRGYERLYAQRERWALPEFDELYAGKVLHTAARAVTQARRHPWNNVEEERAYLQSICQDEMFRQSLPYYAQVRSQLKPLYRVLIFLMRYENYPVLELLLRV